MDEARTGVVEDTPPDSPSAPDPTWLPAGVVTFGVEYRRLGADGDADQGLSIRVVGSDDRHEYLRFDVFDQGPHYHYFHPDGDDASSVVRFDPVALGDMLPFAIGCLRSRLPQMLTRAGGGGLVDGLDPAVIGPALDDVDRLARDGADAPAGAASVG